MPDSSDEGRSSLILRRDHVAGGVFIAAGVLVFALSGDLPFGTLASPGAGMMPKLSLALLILFGAVLVVRAAESPPLASIPWNDFSHAAVVVLIAGAATLLYTRVGFVVTIALLLFVLIYIVERRGIVPALAVSIGVTLGAYTLFNTLLKTPLPRFPFWF